MPFANIGAGSWSIISSSLLLDTGATNTTIDSNALYLLGYDLKDSIGTVEIETASGIIETEIFEVERISSFGVT